MGSTVGQTSRASAKRVLGTAATVIGILTILGLPSLVSPDQLSVIPLAIWGALASVGTGFLGAAIWIRWSHGWPFGARSLHRDLSSPDLRRVQRKALLAGLALVGSGVVASLIAIGYYPSLPPVGAPTEDTPPAEYALGILTIAWILFTVGSYWLTTVVYWSAVLRYAARVERRPPGS